MKSYASLTFKVVSFIISPLGEERFGKKRGERSHHQSRNTSIHPKITNPCQFVFTRSQLQCTFGYRTAVFELQSSWAFRETPRTASAGVRGHLGIIAMVQGEAIILGVVGVVCFSSKKLRMRAFPCRSNDIFPSLGCLWMPKSRKCSWRLRRVTSCHDRCYVAVWEISPTCRSAYKRLVRAHETDEKKLKLVAQAHVPFPEGWE